MDIESRSLQPVGVQSYNIAAYDMLPWNEDPINEEAIAMASGMRGQVDDIISELSHVRIRPHRRRSSNSQSITRNTASSREQVVSTLPTIQQSGIRKRSNQATNEVTYDPRHVSPQMDEDLDWLKMDPVLEAQVSSLLNDPLTDWYAPFPYDLEPSQAPWLYPMDNHPPAP
jgi:hypothetical protein